jgi:hypothetical protein
LRIQRDHTLHIGSVLLANAVKGRVLIGLRKRAAGQPRPNFEPLCSLAASCLMPKLVRKVVKTAKYSSVLLKNWVFTHDREERI